MISVIVQCSENTAYLTRCLKSLKRQTVKELEVILLTDSLIESDMNFGYKILYVNEKNICDSINEALNLAHGEYVFFCEPSSILTPNALEQFYNTIVNNESTYISSKYYYEVEDAFEISNCNLVSLNNKFLCMDVIRSNNIQMKKGNSFAEELFLADYVSKCNSITDCGDVCIYELCNSEKGINSTDYEINAKEWEELTQAIYNMDEEIAPIFAEELGKKIEQFSYIPEELVWITEEKLHKYYQIQYAVSQKVLTQWWYDVQDHKDVDSFSKIKSLLEKYEGEQDFQELLLNTCGLKIEQYKYIKEYDLHNALFYIEKTEISDPVERSIEGNYEQIVKRLGAIKSSQLLLERALGVGDNKNNSEEQSILNGETEGLVKVGAVWYYYKNGAVDLWYNGLAKNDYGWFYVRRGMVDRSFSGIATNQYGEWVVEDGTICKTANGYKKIDNREIYVVNGKVDRTKNGLIASNATMKFYRKGEVDTSFNGLTQLGDKWYYLEQGTVNYSFKGLVSYGDKWWYVENGTINTAFEGYAKNENGWYYVKNGTICEVQPQQPTLQTTQENISENCSTANVEMTGKELADYAIGKYATGELGLKTIFKSLGAWIKYKLQKA